MVAGMPTCRWRKTGKFPIYRCSQCFWTLQSWETRTGLFLGMRSGSRSVIQDHSDYGAPKEPMNSLKSRIHQLLWCTIHDPSDVNRVIPREQTRPWTIDVSFFLSFVPSKKHGHHTLLPSTSTSWSLSFSFSVIKLSSYSVNAATTPLQVVPCPHSLVPLNRSFSDWPGPNVEAPGRLLVDTALSKVVYCTFIEPKPSLDTSRGGSPRKSPSSKLSTIASKNSFTVCTD